MKFFISLIALMCLTFAVDAAVLKDKKKLSPQNNEIMVTKVIYDFAKDGGSVASYEVAEATDDVMILGVTAEGITSLDSAGDAVTVDLGITGAGTTWLNASAQSLFEAGDLTATGTYVAPVKLADGNKVLVEFKTAAPTAGKIVFTIFSAKFGF